MNSAMHIFMSITAALIISFLFALITKITFKFIRGESPSYWNAYKAEVIASVSTYLFAEAVAMVTGFGAFLWILGAQLVIPAVAYVNILRLPSGSAVSFGPAFAVSAIKIIPFGVIPLGALFVLR